MILRPDQRLRVFVSSTLQELAGERAAVREEVFRELYARGQALAPGDAEELASDIADVPPSAALAH